MALLAEIVTSTKFVVGELWAFDPESDKDVRGGNRDRSLHDSSQRRPSRPPADHSWHAGPLASPGAAKTLPRNHSHQLLHAAVQNNVLRGSPSPARGPPSPFAAIRPGAAALEDGAFEEARAGLQERHASPDTSGHSARGARRSSIGMSAGGTVSPDSSGRGRLGSLGAALVRTGTGMRSALRSSTGMSSASRHSAPDSRALRFTGLRYVRPSFAGPTAGKPLVHGQLPLEDEVLSSLWALYHSSEAEAAPGRGLAGRALEQGRRHFWVLPSMLEDPEQFQEPSVVTAARAFSAVLGVPVPQLGGAHAGRVRAVVLLFLPYFPDAPGDGPSAAVARAAGAYLGERANPALARLVDEAAALVSAAYLRGEARARMAEAAGQLRGDAHARVQELWRKVRVLVRTGWFRRPAAELALPAQGAGDGAPRSLAARGAERAQVYFAKWKGKGAAAFNPPPRAGPAGGACTFVGTFLALYLLGAVEEACEDALELRAQPLMLLGCFGALATLLYAAPASPFAQPRMVLGGHLIGCVSALLVDYFTNPSHATAFLPQTVAAPLSLALTITTMAVTGIVNPPGAAAGLIFIYASEEFRAISWLYLMPVMLGCVMCILVALVVNNALPSRAYPVVW